MISNKFSVLSVVFNIFKNYLDIHKLKNYIEGILKNYYFSLIVVFQAYMPEMGINLLVNRDPLNSINYFGK